MALPLRPILRICPCCGAVKYQPICTYCKQEGGEVPSMREQLKEEYQSGLDSPVPEGDDDDE